MGEELRLFELIKEMNWNLLGTLIIVSSVVAWVGDVVGMKLGKKRITFLSLRPKHTSRIISVMTGIGIAIFTLFAISIASEPVRTALFSMNYVQNQITSLTAELQKNRSSLQGMELELFASKDDLEDKQVELQNVEKKLAAGTKKLKEANAQLDTMRLQVAKTEEKQANLLKENAKIVQESKNLNMSIRTLKDEAEKLKGGIQKLREGRIAVLTGELVAQGVIQEPSVSSYQAEQFISRLSDEVCAMMAYRFGKKKEDIPLPVLDDVSYAEVKTLITKNKGRWLVRMMSSSNAVEGEPVKITLQAYKTKLIFKAEETLYETLIPAQSPRNVVEEIVFKSLKMLNADAVRKGVLRDPLTGNVGSIDTAEFMDYIEGVTLSSTDKKLKIVAAGDIYTEGPVKVKLILK